MSYANLYKLIRHYALYITICYYPSLWTIEYYGLLKSRVYTLLYTTNHPYQLLSITMKSYIFLWTLSTTDIYKKLWRGGDTFPDVQTWGISSLRIKVTSACMICWELVYPIGIDIRRNAPRGVWKVVRSLDRTSSFLWSNATNRSSVV